MSVVTGVVIQLKTLAGVLTGDESSSNNTVEKTRLFQRILVYVVSIFCSFIDLNSNVKEKAHLYSNTIEFSVPRNYDLPTNTSSSIKVPNDETMVIWHNKAVVSVMEAGGLNWLVGKVRIYVFHLCFPFVYVLGNS